MAKYQMTQHKTMASIVRPMQTKHKEIVQIHKASFILQI